MEEYYNLVALLSGARDLETLTGLLDSIVDINSVDLEGISRILTKRNSSKLTWLHRAIFVKSLPAILCLLKFHADADIKCFGTPCLHLIATSMTLPGSFEFGINSFKELVSHCDLMARDDQGNSILHVIAEYDLIELFNYLRDCDGFASLLECQDRTGYRPLHRAAHCNSQRVLNALIAEHASVSSQTATGLTALHIAGSFGYNALWQVLVSTGAANPITGPRNRWHQTAAQYIELFGYSCDPSNPALLISNAELSTASHQTAIVTHPICRQHHTCPASQAETTQAPPENKTRLSVLLDEQSGILRSSLFNQQCYWIDKCRPAAMADILRVHEWSYVRRVQAICERLSVQSEAPNGIGSLDGDTTVSRFSFEAAVAAAGAVCEAVDLVISNKARNAFCPVRPPGHHAGPRGLVASADDGPDSHGFCLLNNISIGAAYAMHVHRDVVKRVAIVDFDVHHGNGTEETVKWLTPGVEVREHVSGDGRYEITHTPLYKPWHDSKDPENVLFVSVHGHGVREVGLEEYMPKSAFYPGTGSTTLPPTELLSVRSDAKEPSESAAESRNQVNTNSNHNHHNSSDDGEEEQMDEEDDEEEEEEEEGKNGNNSEQDDDEDDDDDEEDADYGDSDHGDQENNVAAVKTAGLGDFYRMFDKKNAPAISPMAPLVLDIGVPLPSSASHNEDHQVLAADDGGGSYRHQWRNYFREEIFPRLLAFQPDMIFISAGFDAHRKDTINGGYIALVEEDFEWVTENLIKIANTVCNGRIVSALEGGYQIGGNYCSSFAKSVKTHVSALSRFANHENSAFPLYVTEISAREQAIEQELLTEAHLKRIEKLQAKEAAQQALLSATRMDSMLTSSASDVAASGATAAPEVQEPEGGVPPEEGARKRRRNGAAVDYVALEKQLRESEKSNAAN